MLGDRAAERASLKFHDSLSSITSTSISDKDINAIFQTAHNDILQLYEDPPKSCSYIAPSRKRLSEYKMSQNKDKVWFSSEGYKRPLEFGTTALLCILIEETKELVVAWTGDSKALLVSHDPLNDGLILKELTESHNGMNIKEFERIKKQFTNSTINHYGYITPKGTQYGHQLAMTRALGHKFFTDYGVIPKPQIRRINLNNDDEFLVLGSDGKFFF